MMTVRNSNHLTALTGWPVVGVLAMSAITKALTALVMSAIAPMCDRGSRVAGA